MRAFRWSIGEEEKEEDAWLKLEVIDLSYNDLSYISDRLFDSPIRTVRSDQHHWD